ncbi:uncharacterized protein LOC143249436 [Tachypleus tridentatus]|uniref:uncharacterized protein LOC143249436 n=1 Tax=Tachypleus tridentatus TaxID=6853 RepID=UPI003FD2B433
MKKFSTLSTRDWRAICSHQKDFQDSDEESVLAVRRLEQLGSDRSDYSDILNPPLPTEIMSSVESSSSDSEESSSGSESKESNVSGRLSPESPTKHNTQSWGLANFMEKKDLHSLASIKDVSSSSYHQNIQHPVMSSQQNISLDLADKDSVNWILGKYSSDDIKDYFQSPSPNLLDFDSEALSPNNEGQLLSPVISSPLLKEDTKLEKDALNTHLFEEEKCRSEVQRNNNVSWLEKNYDSEVKGTSAEQVHYVKVQVHTGKTEENVSISESEKVQIYFMISVVQAFLLLLRCSAQLCLEPIVQ